jgi:hypothetical protein
MCRYVLAVCLIVAVISSVCLGEDTRDRREAEHVHRISRRAVFDCRKLSESCRAVPPCCGDLNCYWKDGFSLLKDGVCVDCIKTGLTCRLDNQCCKGTMCQKANMYHFEGTCGPPKPDGSECHFDSQCASLECDIGFWQRIAGWGGKCISKPSA